MIPVEGQSNQFLVGCDRHVNIVEWNGVSETCKVKKTLTKVEQSLSENRFNDAKCDPWGRLFGGTMRHTGDIYNYRDGFFYKYDKGNMEIIFSDIGISNGLTWDKERKLFYYIDSLKYNCLVYDYDSATGTIVKSSERVFAKNIKQEGDQTLLPDGMTITDCGQILISVYNGGKLLHYNRQGKLVKEFCLPAKLTTSVAFGGENLDEMYVTSKADDSEEGGYLFRITGSGLKGLPMSNCKL
ncbi:RGN.2 family protein [Megaselia abdita]